MPGDKNRRYENQTADIPSIGARARMGGGPARFMPNDKPKDAKAALVMLIKFYAREAKPLLLVSVLMLINAGANIFAPYFIGKSIDAMAGESLSAMSTAHRYAFVLLIIYVTACALNITQGVIMNATTQRIVYNLRKSLFSKLQKLPLQYFDTQAHGELMSRFTNDIDNISSTIAQSTAEMISAVVTLLGSLIMMLVLSPVLTAAAVISAPLVFLLTRFIAKRSKVMFIGQQRELGALNGRIEETIYGAQMVKAFNMEDKIFNTFDENNARLKGYSVRAQIWSGLLMPFMNVITNITYVSVMFLGGVLAAGSQAMLGTVASFGTYSRQFAFPLNNIAGMFNNLQSALAGAERVFEVLSLQEETPDTQNAADAQDAQGRVEFKGVTFSYAPGADVLKNMSFTVLPGQKAAFVGQTGAGKTTIVNLLTRFYDVTGGAVLIDGRDIREYKRDSLKDLFSVVLQDTCLFTGTIADNIKYAVPEASQADIEAAAGTAGAHLFIKRLKNGYETRLGGETDALSQGQRQLLAISRAMLCRAPILILDEATSSVDTRTEQKIQKAIARLTRGRTTFVIAHRLSTIRDADIIMVVQNGVIAESGSHEELMNLNGIYAAMVGA